MNERYADIARDMGISLSSVYKICPATQRKRKFKELLQKRNPLVESITLFGNSIQLDKDTITWGYTEVRNRKKKIKKTD